MEPKVPMQPFGSTARRNKVKRHERSASTSASTYRTRLITPNTDWVGRVCKEDKCSSLRETDIFGRAKYTEKINLQWDPIVTLGPKAAFHVSSVIDNTLYIHGGMQDVSSKFPSNQFFKLNLTSTVWEQIRTPGSPALSHHAAVVLENRYMVLIGGWDGRKRVANLHAYDTQMNQWLKLEHSGFPDGAGLSSHTATVRIDGNIIIVGREGSLRIQRKHGCVYILIGNVLDGMFTYHECSDNVVSRSGHTTDLIGKNIYIVGGRSDSLLEKVVGIDKRNHNECSPLTKIHEHLKNFQSPMLKFPCGRRHHISAVGSNCILIHGGETFDGKSHDPVGDMFMISLKPLTNFYQLDCSSLQRAGHTAIVTSERVLVHGGRSGKSTIHSDLRELKLV
ncbi:unnamed protein product [Lymnaea stagnalis]|uniref:Uncharacterized protein n=1 Tax=Lymnaea stagnalis TaxID=6523 RepID=A0AAV2HQU5_LYMST